MSTNFQKLELKTSYDTGEDDVVESFYIPVLSKTKTYDRIAGYFTSSSLAISARGLQYLIENKGKMRLLVSPYLIEEDIKTINTASLDPEKYIATSLNDVISNIDDEDISNYRDLMGWMIANDVLEIKTVLIKNSNGKFMTKEEIDNTALFHQKVGICQDDIGNLISFVGSINETASAWTKNIENFKVFKSWLPGQQEYCFDDVNSFNDYWYNKKSNVVILDIPEAVKNNFIQYGKKDINEIINAINKVKSVKKNIDIPLFSYQQEAVDKWVNNKYRLLFEMATGSGKTRTAIACMMRLIKRNERNVFIIATPQSTLSQQWKDEVEKFYDKFNKKIIVDSTNIKGQAELKAAISRINIKTYENVIVYTTHATCSKPWFLDEINRVKSCEVTLVADEVHGLGSKKQQIALLEKYQNRIGLSATPERFFDEEGSLLLKQYFGNQSFQFTIKDALTKLNPLTNKTFLCPYYYYLKFASLNENEMELYINLTKRIQKQLMYQKKEDDNDLLENLLFKRANIIKSAADKLEVLKELISDIGPSNVERTIIFTSPEQKNEVIKYLREMDIPAELFTQEQDSKVDKSLGMSERQRIIKRFKENEIKVLVAIKCLDEGIDIPEADTAILMASTKNPREYIQRIGRVIRNYESKRYAKIYDFVCLPNMVDQLTDSILQKEIERTEYIAEMAENSIQVILELYERIGK